MKKAATGVRLLMGLIFFVFGLNGFLNFIPFEPEPEFAATMGGLMALKYLIPLAKFIEVVVGAALLTNKFVPLALTLIAPIVVNIFLIHAFFDPSGLIMGGFLVFATAFLAHVHRDAFLPMLKP